MFFGFSAIQYAGGKMGQIGAFAQKKGVWLWALRKPKHEKKGARKTARLPARQGKRKQKPPGRTP
jgi:hypothetical protein